MHVSHYSLQFIPASLLAGLHMKKPAYDTLAYWCQTKRKSRSEYFQQGIEILCILIGTHTSQTTSLCELPQVCHGGTDRETERLFKISLLAQICLIEAIEMLAAI